MTSSIGDGKKAEWAIKVDIRSPVDDFHKRIPNMAYTVRSASNSTVHSFFYWIVDVCFSVAVRAGCLPEAGSVVPGATRQRVRGGSHVSRQDGCCRVRHCTEHEAHDAHHLHVAHQSAVQSEVQGLPCDVRRCWFSDGRCTDSSGGLLSRHDHRDSAVREKRTATILSPFSLVESYQYHYRLCEIVEILITVI